MSKGKLLALTVVWLVIMGLLAVAWKLLIQPSRDQQVAVEEETRITETGSASRYDHHITIGLDSFSGYAVLRSRAFRDELVKKRIDVDLSDDKAVYQDRLQNLKSGKTQFAVFTIDALLKTSQQSGDLPGSIISIIDETRGADAIVAYASKFKDIDDLNRADVKFVLTPDSPSETLVRVLRQNFNLDMIKGDPYIKAADANEVYRRYRSSSQNDPYVYVLWEPFVSKALESPNTKRIIGSERFRGYIVDVLVVSRDWLRKDGRNHHVARDVVESYFRAAYQHRGDMAALVYEDAKSQKEIITPKQAANLVEGVWWRNTQENFAHFGVIENTTVQPIEDIIANITEMLVATSAMSSDPTNGNANYLYYDKVLRELHEDGFHPGIEPETIREEGIKLPELSASEWEMLEPVGTLKVPQLVFARGSTKLTAHDRAVLDGLAETLQTQNFYVLIRGNANRKGNIEANKRLAGQRAEAAADYLAQKGIATTRMKPIGDEPSGQTNVSFILKQLAY